MTWFLPIFSSFPAVQELSVFKVVMGSYNKVGCVLLK